MVQSSVTAVQVVKSEDQRECRRLSAWAVEFRAALSSSSGTVGRMRATSAEFVAAQTNVSAFDTS
jgi:hypothetical protein